MNSPGTLDRVTLRQLRALRGAGAAAVTVLLAALAHTLGGGGAPAPLLLLAVTLLATPLCVLFVGRRLSVAGLTLAVVAAQAMFHVAFMATATVGSTALTASEHAHHSLTVVSIDGAAPVVAVDPQMIAHHLGAALLTLVLLHHGERMLRAVARGITALLPSVVLVPVAETRVALRAVAHTPAAPRHPLFSSDARRRGPPTR